MKKIGILVLFSLWLLPQAKAIKTSIKIIDLDKSNEKYIFQNLHNYKVDTLQFKEGNATFTIDISETTPIIFMKDPQKYYYLFLEAGKNMNLTIQSSTMQINEIKNGELSTAFLDFSAKQSELMKIGQPLQHAFQQPNSNKDSLQQLLNQLNNQLSSSFFNFIKTHNDDALGSFMVHDVLSKNSQIESSVSDSMFNILTAKNKQSFFGKKISSLKTKMHSSDIGFMAPDFTLPNEKGKKITLKSLRGKYVLIDFWASWCGPCKAEIPNLKTAYEKYHDKGFEILSVSLDDKREKWDAALAQFQMPWLQVSDVKGFQSVVSDFYYIPSIPKTLLLDKTGKIIGKDYRGNALEKKLEELLGK
ncbi:MAG: AhpC/TSA family protein [Chitinophagaceae bacterium]|nr:AhpC/TSA family protein [Chitinophagaceae bacterium]